MTTFPWLELGLEGPADERAIRRAYAARLKVVRPDVDPAAFQRLVQARDLALRSIEHTALRPLARPAAAPEREPPTPPPLETPPAGASPKFPTSTGDDSKPANSRTDLTEPPAETPPVNRAPGIEQAAAASPEEFVKLLNSFVEAWRSNSSLPPRAPILKLLGEQSMAARQKLEVECLRAIAALFENGLLGQTVPFSRQDLARKLIVALDDDYGWTQNDRRLHAFMQPAMADRFGQLLRILHEWERRAGSMLLANSEEQRSILNQVLRSMTGSGNSQAPARTQPSKARRAGIAIAIGGWAMATVLIAGPRPPRYIYHPNTPMTMQGPLPGWPTSIPPPQVSASPSYSSTTGFTRYPTSIPIPGSSPDELVDAGDRRLKLGDLDGAVDLFLKALAADPTMPAAVNGMRNGLIARAEALLARGDAARALSEIDWAMKFGEQSAKTSELRKKVVAALDQNDKGRTDHEPAGDTGSRK